jgi:hypothetical protein
VKSFLEVFFQENLNIVPKIVSVTKFKSKQTNTQYLVIKLQNEHQKALIFRNCHKLKNYSGNISIKDDLSFKERIAREKILKLTKPSRSESSLGTYSKEAEGDNLESNKDIESKNEKIGNLDESGIEVWEDHHAKPNTLDLFEKDEKVKSVCKQLKAEIQARENHAVYMGLIARIATKKRTLTKTGCTCKKKEDVKEFTQYTKIKFSRQHHVGWLLNRLKDARHDLQRIWIAKYGDIKNCYCIKYALEEQLLCTDVT